MLPGICYDVVSLIITIQFLVKWDKLACAHIKDSTTIDKIMSILYTYMIMITLLRPIM